MRQLIVVPTDVVRLFCRCEDVLVTYIMNIKTHIFLHKRAFYRKRDVHQLIVAEIHDIHGAKCGAEV